MGLIGEIFADAGLHIDTASFARYGAELQGAEGGITKFASAHSAALIGAGTAIVGVIGGAAAYGVTLAAGYEKTQLQLEGLLGSQAKAGEMMTWLQGFAAKTPFEFPELAEASTKFLSAGMNAKEFMTIVGDVAAGTNKSIDQVTEAFIDAQTGEWERLKELGIQHVEIQKNNYEQLGITADKVGQDMLFSYDASGKKIVEVFDKHSKEATEAALKNLSVEKFAGSMDKVANSLSGKWSTIKDNINNALVDIVGFEVGEKQASGLYLALQKLADVAISVTGAVSGLSEPMQTAITIAAVGGLAVGGLAIGIGLVGTASSLATPGMTALAVSINAAIWPATLVVTGIALLAAGLIYLDEKTGIVSAGWQVLKDIFTITVDDIGNIVDRLYNWVVQKVDGISQVISNMIPPGVVSAIGGAIDFISSKFGGMATDIHTRAVGIQGDNKDTATSTTQVGTSFTTAGIAAQGAGTGFNAAAGGLANTNSQAKAAAGGLNSVTQAALSAIQATKQLWAAQNEIAKNAITIRQAEKTVGQSYSSSGGKGSVSPEGVRVVSNPNSYTANEAASRQAARNTTINVGTINNNGSSQNATKTAMALTSRG
jgi:hypothetical protein